MSMKCTVFRVNVPYFYTSVPGKGDRMLAGLVLVSCFDSAGCISLCIRINKQCQLNLRQETISLKPIYGFLMCGALQI